GAGARQANIAGKYHGSCNAALSRHVAETIGGQCAGMLITQCCEILLDAPRSHTAYSVASVRLAWQRRRMPRPCRIGCQARELNPGTLPGPVSSCAMSIETLNTAVRAAGFAMATADEPADANKPDELPRQSEAWRPGEAVLLGPDEMAPDEVAVKATPTIAERLKGGLGLLGRGAPA